MQGPDLVLFTAGALIFATAAYGLVQTDAFGEEAPSASGLFDVAWSDSAPMKESLKQGFSEGAPLTARHPVAMKDLRSLAFTATCADTNPASGQAPASVAFDVTPPAANHSLAAKKASGACGTPLTIEYADLWAPNLTAVPGETEAEARAHLNASASTLGNGDWTITVTVTRANPTGQPLPLQQLGGASGSVAVQMVHAEARLTPRSVK